MQNHAVKMKRNLKVINDTMGRWTTMECVSEINSDCSEEIQDIDDYLYANDEEDDRFIPTCFNDKKTLQKFLQREMDLYSTAFPNSTLSQKFYR